MRQPAETGPVLFTNTSPAYVQLQRVEGGGDDGGSNTGLIIGVAAAGVAVLAGVGPVGPVPPPPGGRRPGVSDPPARSARRLGS